MIKPLATVDCNSQERLPPYDQLNALPIRKGSVTVIPVQEEHIPVRSTPIAFVSHMLDMNVSAFPFDLACLSCPLQTLSRTLESRSSACITTIDIAQAYQTIYNRLRASSNMLIAINQDPAQISQPKNEISTLVQCLRRDISEGLQFFSRVQAASFGKSSIADSSFTSTLEDPEIQMSIDSSLLCQSALRVAATLMMVPALHTLASDAERTILLHPIIEICVERHLPVFDHDKVQCLAFSCLRTDAAGAWLSPSQLEGIVEAITSALDIPHSVNMQMHALKAIRHFLQLDPTRYIQSFSATLPKIMAFFAGSSGVSRMEAVATICRLALAKCHIMHTFPDVIMSISTEVHEFLAQHKSRRKSVGDDHLLPGILREAINGDGAIWAHTSLAALVILGDAHIFSHPHSLRLILDALRYSSRHKSPAVANLHTEVWKCLVWVLSRSLTVSDEAHIDTRKDTYQRAFQLLTQEMRPGIGTRLVCVLMQNHSVGDDERFRAWKVQEAVNIIEQLVKRKSSRHFQEGLALLHRLVGGPTSSEGFDNDPNLWDYIRPGMVDGSWAQLSLSELDKRLSEAHPISLSFMHPLTESEVQTHWEALSESWAATVERVQSALTAEILDQLTRTWQFLLLSQAHLTQGRTHLSSSSALASRFATMITQCLLPAAEPGERIRQLALVRKWWNVLKNVFDRSWLSVPAGLVLDDILEKKVDLSDTQVHEIWSKVCFELISASIPTLLQGLRTRAAGCTHEASSSEGLAVRGLWLLYGRHCVRVGSESWADLVSLLSLPFLGESWILSEKEMDMWNQIFSLTLLAAERDGVSELQLVQHISERVDESRRDMVILTLLEAAVAHPPKLAVCRRVARLVDNRLLEWYTAGDVVAVYKAMVVLGRFWRVEEPAELVASVALVQQGISTWLLDERGRVSDVEHTEMVKVAFIPVLDRLASDQFSSPHLLTVLEPLFVSVFHKPISLAADAFMEFYRKHGRGQPNLRALCPERLLTAAKSYADLCDEPLEDSNSVMTPTSPLTVISDSQDPVSPRKRSLRHEYSRFEEFQDMVGYGFQVDGDRNVPRSRSRISDVATTPTATASRRQLKTPSSIPGASMVDDGIRENGSTAIDSPALLQRTPEIPVPPTRRVPKRHHTEGNFVSSGESGETKDAIESKRPLKRAKTLSGPVLSPAAPNRLSSPYRSLASQQRSRQPLTGSPLPPSSYPEPGPEGEDDYDSWEAGISHKDIQALRDELNVQVDTEAEEEGQFDDADSDLVLGSPNPGNGFPFRSRRRRRSQTAPEPSPQSPLLNPEESFARQALRRRHTSGSFESDENTQINAVRHAYAAVVESDGVSQMGVEELLQLKRLASRIGQTVDEQLEQQLEKEGKVGGGKGKSRAYSKEKSRTPS